MKTKLPSSLVWTVALLIALSMLPKVTCTQGSPFAVPSTDQVWTISDDIIPTPNGVEWRESGELQGTVARVADEGWWSISCSFYLIQSEYIFASFEETFDWDTVNATWHNEWGKSFPSPEEIESKLRTDPMWWLQSTWQLDTEWLGITPDATRAMTKVVSGTSKMGVRVWCRITNIPGFFLLSTQADTRRLAPLLAGFDISGLMLGSFETLQWTEHYDKDFTKYTVSFKTAANVLTRSNDIYTFALGTKTDQINDFEQARTLRVSMPAETYVRNSSAPHLTTYNNNVATFQLHGVDAYPNSLWVLSGPLLQDFPQVFLDNARQWVLDPTRWLAFGSLIVLAYTAVQGKRLLSRQKTYSRLSRRMVTAYHQYTTEPTKFTQEMDAILTSVAASFIDEKINEDQFDKLVSRHDDLTQRVPIQTRAVAKD